MNIVYCIPNILPPFDIYGLSTSMRLGWELLWAGSNGKRHNLVMGLSRVLVLVLTVAERMSPSGPGWTLITLAKGQL